jgi:protein SCO1/2
MLARSRTAVALSLLAATGALAACGGSSSSKPVVEHKSSPFQGAVANPPKPAPPLKLRDSTGKALDIASLRGKVVLITFIYSHCPDICPLITGNLHTVVKQLGPRAAGVQVVAVSTDPRGDTPGAVKKFLALHQMTGTMRYLLGSKSELGNVWKSWGIVAAPDKANPDQVEHSALIYGISSSGKITTLYPANFKPAQIVHDVPLLAKQ